MPRGKIPISLIGNARMRTSTFARRKEGLVKKARELATLCGVDVAVVCVGPGGRAPGLWESREGVIQRYRALPPEKRLEHTHLNYVKGELAKEKAKLARVRQGGPLALAPWAEALDGMSLEELLGSIDAALLATAERRKELGLPEDAAADGDQLRWIASDALAPCSGDGFEGLDGWVEELMWDGAQPMDALNADVMQPASGVQYINGGSVDMEGNQYPQLQMPGNGNNNLSQFAWDAYQPNAAVHPGYGYQFTDGNYMDMQLQSSQMQVPGNVNAQHNDWLSPGMWGADESSCHAFAPGSSAYRLVEQCTPCIGDNFTGAPGNFMDVNGNEYKTQCLADDLQCPYYSQDFGLHYLSDLADGVHF